MQFEIFTDSSANIPDELLQERGIHIIPYTFTENGAERTCYAEGVPFRELAKEHYAKLRAGKDMRTSLLSMQNFIEALTPALEAGQDVFLITIASGISGTFAQAMLAQKALEKKFPRRKIVVADSSNASMGEGLLVLRVADLRDMGESIDACARWFENNRYKVNSYVTVGDLKYLRKGGRISAAAAIAGTLLNIKPILRADGERQAKLVICGKERGRKRAVAALLAAFDSFCASPEGQTVAITHADCEEEALALSDALKERGVRDVIVEYYDLCTGIHVGPDTIALFFFGKDRRAPAPEKSAVPKKGALPLKNT